MQNPSSGWESNGTIEYAFVINGVSYGPEAEVEHTVNAPLFSELGIGNAMCATLNLTLYAESVPRGAKIERKVRTIYGSQVSEWVPKGVFWANRRSEEDGLWDIEAYDAMRKADMVWEPDQNLVFPMPMSEAVTVIAELMGVEVDERTLPLIGDYTIDYPTSEQTLRQTLCWIAAANGGNFIISDAGALRLVDLGGELNNWISGFHEIGQDLISFSNNGKFKPISRVTLWVDDEHSLTAGDDSGLEIEADCPYATEDNQMAENILYYLEGYEYQAFEANAARISPLMELGDRVLAGTGDAIVSFVAAEITDDGSWYPNVSAPGEAEMEDEYPFEGPLTLEFNRKIAEAQSEIAKTAEEISQRVESANGKATEAATRLDGFTVTTYNEDGTVKSVKLANGTVTADTIAAGAVTADKIAAGELIAAKIQGETVELLDQDGATIGTIVLEPATSSDFKVSVLSDGALELVASAGNVFVASANNELMLGYRPSIAYGLHVRGHLVPFEDDTYYCGSVAVTWAGIYTATAPIVSSDKNLKHDIKDLPQKYLDFVMWLSAKIFKMNNGTSGRDHVGFIAQDVEEGMSLHDIDSLEFAGFVKGKDKDGNDVYMLRYEEFIGLLQAVVKKHEARIKRLEQALGLIEE